jgi:hypothetical protein
MNSVPTSSPRLELSWRQRPRALSEIAHRPALTPSTSVTPSPVKSPNRSLLIGNDELWTLVQAGADNAVTCH